jgi:RNA polymerase sigma-B factor
VSQDDVLEALEARHAYSTGSIDVGAGDDENGSGPLTDRLGFEEEGFESIDDRESLRPLLELLPERERRILFLRFFRNMSQTQIAHELGISQMHVSRLLASSLARLHEGLQEPYSA